MSTDLSARRPPFASDEGVSAASPPVRSCAPACPRCASRVVRIPRRFVDRLLGIVHPLRRYRCPSFLCCWEGNLPVGSYIRAGRNV